MSGLASFVPFARYHRASSSWKTWPPISASGLTSYLATWPKQGMTVAGIAYRRVRQPVRHTSESASSSLRIHDDASSVRSLLASAIASERKKAGESRRGGPALSDVILLPTPRASDPGAFSMSDNPKCLRDVVIVYHQGIERYLPALRRWQTVIGRKWPRAKVISRANKETVSATFIEWMMGLREGWVTSLPVTLSRQKEILGAGVVPQQAEYAIRAMTGLQDE